MKEKLAVLLEYIAARLAEPSTWQAITFFLTAIGSHYAAEIDPVSAVAIGVGISKLLSIIMPDAFKKAEEIDKMPKDQP
jgi:hypothetical protein